MTVYKNSVIVCVYITPQKTGKGRLAYRSITVSKGDGEVVNKISALARHGFHRRKIINSLRKDSVVCKCTILVKGNE